VHLVRSLLAAGKADDVAFSERVLALRRPERRLAAQDDEPLFVGVVGVVRPQSVAGLELVHASAEQLGPDACADPRVLAAPALAVLGAIPLVTVQVEDLHRCGA
jgi:hypothetical protein